MILATWQPSDRLKEYIKQADESKKFSEGLVYRTDYEYKIWCIGAETIEDFLVNTILTFVKFPEVLYIFETDDYKMIDKVKWYKTIQIQKDKGSIINQELFITENKNIPVEYLVKKIPENAIKIEVNQYQREIENPKKNRRVDEFKKFYSNVYKQPKYTNYYDTFYSLKENQLNFITTILPILWEKEFSYNDSFDYSDNIILGEKLAHDAFIYKANDKLNYWDSIKGNWSRTLYKKLEEEIYGQLKKEISPRRNQRIYNSVGRNEACPCGSGMKFKRCHGK